MSKRLVSFLLAFIMLIGSFTPAFANGIIIGDESNSIIGDKPNEPNEPNNVIINNEENIDDNNSLYEDEETGQIFEENSGKNLESSIIIENDKKTDEKQSKNPSSLVIDNNNTGTEDNLEVSEEKKLEAQTADNNVPPAKDFNEEITEFKQYVRNVTEGQPDSDFVEELDFHQTPDEVNKIEHKFTLKTRPLSRDYKPGELVIDLTGIEKTREYLDSENNMVGCKITSRNIISNDSEFFSRKSDKINTHGEDVLFKYCTELTNKTTLRKGETIDVSYIYQELINDIYMKNNSTVTTNVYLNGELMQSTLLVTYSSDIVNDSFYPYNTYWSNHNDDNINSYRNSHLGENYGFEGKDYRIIDIGYSNISSSYLDKSRERITPVYSRLLADFDPYISDKGGISTTRTLMLNTPLNGVFPKLILNADKDLIYLKADGTVENFKAGSDIILVENGQIVRDFGKRENTIEREKKNIGIFFVKRDGEQNTTVNVSIKLKNTFFKDENNLIPEKVVRPIKVYINKKLPPDQEPRIRYASASANSAYYEQYLSYKDLFSGVKTFYSPDIQADNEFFLKYDNPTELESDSAPKIIKILEVVYNKTNPSENYIYESKSFSTFYNKKIEQFAEGLCVIGAYKIDFEGIEELYKKLDPDECFKRNYSAKRIYVVEDTSAENGTPFFKNFKTIDNYDKLQYEIKNSLSEIIDPLRKREGVAVYQIEDTVSQTPLLHFYGGRLPTFLIKNGCKLGDQFVFNSTESNYLNFSIFQNILASKDDELEMTFEISLPAGVTYIGNPKLTVNDSDWTTKIKTKPLVKNIDGKSTLLLKITGNEIKEINKTKVSTDTVSEVRAYNSEYLTLELPGKFIVDKDLINSFNGYISWGSNYTMKTTVKTSIENIEIFTQNDSNYDSFESHIVKPSNIAKTDDGKFLFTYTGTKLYGPSTTLDYYISKKIKYEKSPEFIAGISNSVKGPEDQSFTIAPKMINFEDFYENKITVQTASTPMTDVVIYNDIENANPEFLNWKGTLKNIDLSEFTNQGFVVETYINKAKHSKNIKDDGWEKYNGSEDLSDVKSLAFKIMDKDGNPGILPKESEYSIILKMQAPSEDKVPKVDGKPTHSYSKVFTDWRSVNDKTMSGAESFTIRMSMIGSVTDDIIATVNHQVKINRVYSNNFTDQEKKENNIVTLVNTKTGNKYITNGNTISYVEPGEYSISYKIEKGIEVNGNKTIEITDEYKDSIDTINVTYNKPDKTNPDDEPGFIDKDTRENKFKITITTKK